jgi:hypothetical protein
MRVAMMLAAAAAAWVGTVAFAVSLGRAAKRGDDRGVRA